MPLLWLFPNVRHACLQAQALAQNALCSLQVNHPLVHQAASSLGDQNVCYALQDARRKTAETGEPMALPITVRQLEAIVRLSEALAKMQL